MRSAALGRVVANFLGFQAAWLACVGGAGHGVPMLGLAAAALWLSVHVALLGGDRRDPDARSGDRGIELRLLAAAAVAGYVFDGALVLVGVIEFPEHAGLAVPTTPWMVALWAAFAATLRHSLNWARRRYALGAVAGAVFGPIAYVAGETLGAIALAAPPLGWLAIAATWALAMPLLLWLRERLERAAPGEARKRDARATAGSGR